MLHALLLSLALSPAPQTPPAVTSAFAEPLDFGGWSEAARGSSRGSSRDEQRHIPRYGPNVIEVALEDESFWFFVGRRFAGDDGYFGVGYLGGDLDEELLDIRLLRYGGADGNPPIALGVGLGIYVARIENPDMESFSSALMGSIETRMERTYPLRFVLEGAYAPDVSSFGDGDQLVDLWGRVEVEISDVAQAFVGYRVVHLEFDDGTDYDLGETVQVGVRLGF